MKRYKILKLVILGFHVEGERCNAKLKVDEDTLESDGHTIWAIIDGTRQESITQANAIGIWLQEGRIAEIPVS